MDRVILVSILVIVIVSIFILYIVFISEIDNKSIYRNVFKNYVRSIAKKTSGFTLIRLNITFIDGYNYSNKYLLVIRLDNNYCCYYLDAILYYNETIIAEYYYGAGESFCEGEWLKIYNEELFDKFVTTFLMGYDNHFL